MPEAEMKQTAKDRIDMLCQCGWGLVGVDPGKVPEHCPDCGFNFWEFAEDQEGFNEELDG